MCMCVQLNLIFNSGMKDNYVTQMLEQGINIETMCPTYILEISNTNYLIIEVFLGAWVKFETAIENHVG